MENISLKSSPVNSKINYIIHWEKKHDANSAVFKYFITSLKDVRNQTKYWIPFKYANKSYLMTFNNCYEVEYIN